MRWSPFALPNYRAELDAGFAFLFFSGGLWPDAIHRGRRAARHTIMKTMRPFCWALLPLIFLSQTAHAYLDIPLKWKIQQWQFVIVVEAQERMTNTGNSSVLKKEVVRILRGKKEDLPQFEDWQHNDLEKGRYYLLAYRNYKAPLQPASWGERFNVEKTNATLVVKAIQDNQTHGFYQKGAVYSDLRLDVLEKLLRETPFELNPTNTFFYKAGHHAE
jgi:hypothetical protein